MDLNKLFKELEEELKRGNYTREEKAGIINDVGNIYKKQIDKELNDYLTRQYIGTGLEIGSAALPVGGIVGQTAKRVIPAALSKTVGRKISQDITLGAIGGAIDGAVFGTGRGIVEEENPLKTAVEDSLLGFGVGGALGGATAELKNVPRKKELNGVQELKKYWGSPVFRKVSGDPQKAIDTLIENKRGFVPNVYNKEGLGEFDIPWGKDGKGGFGLAHIIERRTKQGIDAEQFVKDLPDLIKKGDVYGKQGHLEQGYIGDNVKEIAIRQNYKIKDKILPRNWMASAYKFYNDISNEPQAAHVLRTSGAVTSADRIPLQNSGIDNSITDIINKYNLPDRTIPNTSTGIVSAIDNYIKKDIGKKINNPLEQESKPFELRIEKQEMPNGKIIDVEIPTGYAAPIKSINHGFKDLTGYKNPLTGDNRIYTAEDVGEMSGREFGRLEKEIDAQINSIGIPRKKDLGVFSGGTIYIMPYTRADGVKVRGHYRAMRNY